MKYPLSMACVSDIHLGHRNTPTEHIVNNLLHYLCNERVFAELDLLVLAGDVFDDLVHMRSEDSRHITLWMSKLLLLAAKHRVIVRVLEGTPSHDRGQSEHFLNTAQAILLAGGVTVDLQYIKALSVEYIPGLDAHVLYIPDEWRHDTADTLQEVQELLKSKGLAQVDFAVVHGLFTHQAPSVIRRSIVHDSEVYLSLVKHLIFVGHDHHHTTDRRIQVQGSFDRLAHGEQAGKGYLKATVLAPDQYYVTFCENKGAMRYDTLEFAQETTQEALDIAQAHVCQLPEGSHLRIKTQRGTPASALLPVLKQRYPLHHWTLLLKEAADQTAHVLMEIRSEEFTPILLNKGTLVGLAHERASSKHAGTALIALMCQKITEAL
jgi:hypothetical protein